MPRLTLEAVHLRLGICSIRCADVVSIPSLRGWTLGVGLRKPQVGGSSPPSGSSPNASLSVRYACPGMRNFAVGAPSPAFEFARTVQSYGVLPWSPLTAIGDP